MFYIIRFPSDEQLHKMLTYGVGFNVKKKALLRSKHFEEKYIDNVPGTKVNSLQLGIPTILDHMDKPSTHKLCENEYV